MITRKLAYGGAAMLFALGSMTAASGMASAATPSAPAKASTSKCHPKKSGWTCITQSVWALAHAKHGYVKAVFTPRGEHLDLWDHYNNGHRTVAYLKVEGSGTARFTMKKDQTHRDIDLSYSEGKDVWVRVCSSGLSSAVCTGWSGVYKT